MITVRIDEDQIAQAIARGELDFPWLLRQLGARLAHDPDLAARIARDAATSLNVWTHDVPGADVAARLIRETARQLDLEDRDDQGAGDAPKWRHRKTGGLYTIVCVGAIEATLNPCVVYRAEKDGSVWVRPYKEFTDGRFEQVDDHALPAAILDRRALTCPGDNDHPGDGDA